MTAALFSKRDLERTEGDVKTSNLDAFLTLHCRQWMEKVLI